MEKSNLFKNICFFIFIAIVMSIFFIFNDKNPKGYIMNSYFIICNRLEKGKNIDKDFVEKLLEKTEYIKGHSMEVLDLNAGDNIKQSTHIFKYENQSIHIEYDYIKRQIISVKYMDNRPDKRYNIFLSYNEMDKNKGEEYLSTTVYVDSVESQNDLRKSRTGLNINISKTDVSLEEAYFEMVKSIESNDKIIGSKLSNLIKNTLNKTYKNKIIVRDKNGKEREVTSETYVFKKEETELTFEYIEEDDNFRSVKYKNEIVDRSYVDEDYINRDKMNYIYTKININSLKRQEKVVNYILLK